MRSRAVSALILAAFGLVSLLFGCGGDNADVSIVGKWKLVASSGGFSGHGRLPLPDEIVEFTTDSKMMWYEHDEVTGSVRYSIGVDKTILSPYPTQVIYVNDEPSYVYSFPDKDTLVLTENGCDGFSDTYQRL